MIPSLVESRAVDNNRMNDTDTEQYDRGVDDLGPDNARAYELRLRPPPSRQAYCLEHFLMECEMHHEQENDRYNKLASHSREKFVQSQNAKRPSNKPSPAPTPTRCQPTRRAKENHSVLEMTPSSTLPEPQRPPGPRRPSNTPLKPPRLEKAFAKSQDGVMFRILTELHESLELQKSWDEYRRPLENKIQETADHLRVEIQNGRGAHLNCIFGGPLGIRCRYCGFVDTVQDDDGGTPRKLAAPAAMHALKPPARSGHAKESKVVYRGTDFIVDVCGEKAMIILVDFKGVLDLCAELFQDQGVSPGSPASLSAYLGNPKLGAEDPSVAGAKRRLQELGLGLGRAPKKRKSSAGECKF
ncbi:hypothetical protein ONZ43_g4552 [Nemania bipapillata]|uniref:Uncharacterized protein n=1 Tax=Nemania bipapillata TaxID=110536 RepID=A0ACC2ILE1_9PEZI|nr:hypothetical protein ONZ43_g4552 [Nemania bipapillata]